MKNHKRGFVGWIALIVLASLVLVGAWYGQKPKGADLSDWKTYRNEHFGFSINYPTSGYGAIFPERAGPDGAEIMHIYPLPAPQEFGPRLNLAIYPANDSGVPIVYQNGLDVISQDKVVVNSASGLRVVGESKTGAGPEYVYVNYFFSHDGYIYSINYNKTFGPQDQLFERVIKTFRFTDNAAVSSNHGDQAVTLTGVKFLKIDHSQNRISALEADNGDQSRSLTIMVTKNTLIYGTPYISGNGLDVVNKPKGYIQKYTKFEDFSLSDFSRPYFFVRGEWRGEVFEASEIVWAIG
jgi:hypothetical protein